MTTTDPVLERNREMARQIAAELRANPQSRYAGKFVGLVDGQVSVLADNLDELGRWLEQATPDPQKLFCFEAGEDVDEVHFIWGLN